MRPKRSFLLLLGSLLSLSMLAPVPAAHGGRARRAAKRAAKRVLREVGAPRQVGWNQVTYATTGTDITTLTSGVIVMRDFTLRYPTPQGTLGDLVQYRRDGITPPSASEAKLAATTYIERVGAEKTTFRRIEPGGAVYLGTLTQRPNGEVSVTIDVVQPGAKVAKRTLTALYNSISRRFLVRKDSRSYAFADAPVMGDLMAHSDVRLTGLPLFERVLMGAKGNVDPATERPAPQRSGQRARVSQSR